MFGIAISETLKARRRKTMRTMHINILACTTFAALLAIDGSAEAMPIIRDMCNQTSGDGQGHSCPGPNDLLIRPKYDDGTCGDWMCCPPNPDGQTYDCSHATNPTRSGITGILKGILGQRPMAINPGTTTGTSKQPLFPGMNAPIMRRGVDTDQEQSASEAGSPLSPGGGIQERAIPRQGFGVAEMNCNCDKGSGTCSVTSKDGKTSVCEKGSNDTCTGTCMYPKGTISGFSGAPMMR